MLASVLLLAATLPPVLADPRHGPSDWVFVTPGAGSPPLAAGYLVSMPAGGPDQAWLEGVVALAAGGAPVVALGSELPPAAIRPYLDGVALDPAPAPEGIGGVLDQLAGLPLVLPATDVAEAVACAGARRRHRAGSGSRRAMGRGAHRAAARVRAGNRS